MEDDRVIVLLLDRLDDLAHVHVVESVELAARDHVVRVVGLELTVEGEQHVVGVEIARRGEILHRAELDALAQMEGDGLAAIRELPGFGEARNEIGGAAVEFDELIIDMARGIEARVGGRERRIEILGRAFEAIDQSLGVRRCRRQGSIAMARPSRFMSWRAFIQASPLSPFFLMVFGGRARRSPTGCKLPAAFRKPRMNAARSRKTPLARPELGAAAHFKSTP